MDAAPPQHPHTPRDKDPHDVDLDVEIDVEIVRGAPTSAQFEALNDLARSAEQADGNPPYSEQTLIELQQAVGTAAQDTAAQTNAPQVVSDTTSGTTSSTTSGAEAPLEIAYAWTRDGERLLAGAGVVVLGDGGHSQDSSPDVLELVVRPSYRQHGIGTQLVDALHQGPLSPETGRLRRAWAHGEHDAVAPLSARFGWAPIRELQRLRLSTPEDVPEAELPESVTIRSFEPGRDDEAWLMANAAAFADHPEQGHLTLEDLHSRMAEDWFDPSGFLLAEENGELLGFHWTKVHPRDPEEGRDEALGEVYVVGVVPEAQGRGLGKALTLAGIEHLHRRGLRAIMLYVDADNTAAVELYRRLGFTRWDVDIMYAPAPHR